VLAHLYLFAAVTGNLRPRRRWARDPAPAATARARPAAIATGSVSASGPSIASPACGTATGGWTGLHRAEGDIGGSGCCGLPPRNASHRRLNQTLSHRRVLSWPPPGARLQAGRLANSLLAGQASLDPASTSQHRVYRPKLINRSLSWFKRPTVGVDKGDQGPDHTDMAPTPSTQAAITGSQDHGFPFSHTLQPPLQSPTQMAFGGGTP